MFLFRMANIKVVISLARNGQLTSSLLRWCICDTQRESRKINILDKCLFPRTLSHVICSNKITCGSGEFMRRTAYTRSKENPDPDKEEMVF